MSTWLNPRSSALLNWAVNEFHVSTAAPNGSTILSHRETQSQSSCSKSTDTSSPCWASQLIDEVVSGPNFCCSFHSRWARNVSERSSVTPRYTGWCSCRICFPSNKTLSYNTICNKILCTSNRRRSCSVSNSSAFGSLPAVTNELHQHIINIIYIYHRLNGSLSPVLMATCLSHWSLCDFLTFFLKPTWLSHSQPILMQNGLVGVDSRTDVPFGVKITTFCNP